MLNVVISSLFKDSDKMRAKVVFITFLRLLKLVKKEERELFKRNKIEWWVVFCNGASAVGSLSTGKLAPTL